MSNQIFSKPEPPKKNKAKQYYVYLSEPISEFIEAKANELEIKPCSVIKQALLYVYQLETAKKGV